MNSIVWQLPINRQVIEEGSEDYYNGIPVEVRTHLIQDMNSIIMKCPECIYEQVGAEAYDKYSHIPRSTALRSDKRPKDFDFNVWSKVSMLGFKEYNMEDRAFSDCIFGLDKNGEHIEHTGARLCDEIHTQMILDLEKK
tara:strand:+ start:136 stop:552 length:417 start_codon:yes stop_codon:yes gene_type:complete